MRASRGPPGRRWPTSSPPSPARPPTGETRIPATGWSAPSAARRGISTAPLPGASRTAADLPPAARPGRAPRRSPAVANGPAPGVRRRAAAAVVVPRLPRRSPRGAP
jgi:hypothetical protein